MTMKSQLRTKKSDQNANSTLVKHYPRPSKEFDASPEQYRKVCSTLQDVLSWQANRVCGSLLYLFIFLNFLSKSLKFYFLGYTIL